MRTGLLIGAVVAAHIVAVGSVVLIQGCSTTPDPLTDNVEPVVMPPSLAAPPPAPPPPPGIRPALAPTIARTTPYVIGKGECLSSIAQKFNLKASDIASLNGITDPNKVRAGQKIVLPGAIDTARPAPPRPTPVKTAAPQGSEGMYVVKKGDCLSVIASSHGLRTRQLMEANRLTSDRIRVGQKLMIPGKTVSAPPVAGADAPSLPVKTPKTAALEAMRAPEVDAGTPPRPPSAPQAILREHTVAPNDSLLRIAMMYAVSEKAVRELNGLPEGDIALEPGTKLKIPAE